MWVRSPVTTDNFSILYFVTLLIHGTVIKIRAHRGFNPQSSSPESPVCTTSVHCHKMTREMVVYKSVWTQGQKKDERSEISTTGLRSWISEGPRAFAGLALSECHFLLFCAFSLLEFLFSPLFDFLCCIFVFLVFTNLTFSPNLLSFPSHQKRSGDKHLCSLISISRLEKIQHVEKGCSECCC